MPSPPLPPLDEAQRNLAEGLGSGYRVIRGVAGSGKTIVLMRRAAVLAERHPQPKLLYTCFNSALRKYVQERLGHLTNLTVSTVDTLALSICSGAGRSFAKTSEGFDEAAVAALELVRDGQSSVGPFDAVLVDEAQDLDAVRLDLLHGLLASEESDFVLVKDGAQNIYRKHSRWNPPGQTARGRTSLLRRNYRNTRQILELAYFFLRSGESDESVEVDDDEPMVIVPPTTGARMGDPPRVELFSDAQAALNAVCSDILESIAVGVSPDRMAVLVGGRRLRARLYHTMQEHEIPYLDLSHNKWSDAGDAVGKVHGATFQKLKGLEYEQVYVVGVDQIDAGRDIDDETRRRLLYVAMTRATDRLMVALHEADDPLTVDLLRTVREAQTPQRENEAWASEDHKTLLDGWFSNLSVEEIARQLERSERATRLSLVRQHRIEVAAPVEVPVAGSGVDFDEECRHGIAVITCSLCLGDERYGRTVWVTRAGAAFHVRPDCDYLVEGQEWARRQHGVDPEPALMISTAQAQMRSLEPCMRCYADT